MVKTCPFCEEPIGGRSRVCNKPECRKQMQETYMEGTIEVPAGYFTAKEFAEKYNISVQAVAKNCGNAKYPGAFQDQQSGRWYIPKDTAPLKRGGAREGAGIKTGTEAAKRVGRKAVTDRRRNRPLKANNQEWKEIEEKATQAGYSTNEYIIRKATDKPL